MFLGVATIVFAHSKHWSCLKSSQTGIVTSTPLHTGNAPCGKSFRPETKLHDAPFLVEHRCAYKPCIDLLHTPVL